MLPNQVADLEARIRVFARDHIPALADGQAVLAVSGGGDSTATASLLCEAGILDPARSIVAYFDHRLRGEAAAAADAAVTELCARYGFELVTGKWDAPRPGEAAAREARYAFLRGAAARAGISVIVTGHTWTTRQRRC